MKRFAWLILMMAATGTALAQNSDLGLLLGVSHFTGETRVGGQANYARQILERPRDRFYIELPIFVPVTPRNEANSATIFITPGVRYHRNLSERVVVYGAFGVGLAVQPKSARTSFAFGLGAGLDYRLTQRWSLRGDFRDFVEGSPGGFLGNGNASVMFGPALHF